MAETREGGVYKVGDEWQNAMGEKVSAPTAAEEAPPATAPSGPSGGVPQRDPSDVHSGPFQEDFPYRDVLQSAGFADQEAVANANDEELLAVDGIGPARLKEIRAYQGG